MYCAIRLGITDEERPAILQARIFHQLSTQFQNECKTWKVRNRQGICIHLYTNRHTYINLDNKTASVGNLSSICWILPTESLKKQGMGSSDPTQHFLPIDKDVKAGVSVSPDCLVKDKGYLKCEFLRLSPSPTPQKNRQCVQCGVGQHTEWHH